MCCMMNEYKMWYSTAVEAKDLLNYVFWVGKSVVGYQKESNWLWDYSLNNKEFKEKIAEVSCAIMYAIRE